MFSRFSYHQNFYSTTAVTTMIESMLFISTRDRVDFVEVHVSKQAEEGDDGCWWRRQKR